MDLDTSLSKYETTLILGVVGGAEAGQPTCNMGTFFQIPLTLTMPISNNFKLNGATEQSLKLWLLQKKVIFDEVPKVSDFVI